MKFKATLSIGILGQQEDTIDVPDEDLDGLNDEDREKLIDQYWQDWILNYIDGGMTPIE